MPRTGTAAMSVEELAGLLGVSPWTIYEAVKETGEAVPGVPAIKIRSRVVFSRLLVERVLRGEGPAA